MKQMNVKTIVFAGLAIAVIFVLTAFVVVPIGQFGYVNLGDSGIMLFASFLNPVLAFVCGGIASAMADLYLGYSHYALFTFIIKGCEALIIALMMKKLSGKTSVIAYFIGGIIMVTGYYFTDAFLLGNFVAAFAGVSFNILQGTTSIVIATLLNLLFMKQLQNSKLLKD